MPSLLGAGRPNICIVTQYTANTAPYAEIAVANQHAFAKRHGYDTMAFRGRISGPAFVAPRQGGLDSRLGGGLYWQKLSALDVAPARVDDAGHPKYEWVMWLDSDIVVTNPETSLESLIETHAPARSDKHVILSREQAGRQDVPVNAGALFVKNSEPGRGFVQSVADMYDVYALHPMPEQDAITDYAFNRQEGTDRGSWDTLKKTLRADVAVAPQRAFNSFVRSHKVDVAEARWQPGDFIAHVSYGNTENRVTRMRDVLAATAPGHS